MNLDKKITVDVVIPVFNGERYIHQSLESVLKQTFQPESIYVVDDGSTDNTFDIVNKVAIKNKKITLLRKTNGGLSSARNAGILICQSEWIGFLDSDDVWKPDKLKLQVRKINKTRFNKLGMIYCDYLMTDKNGSLALEINRRRFKLDRSIQGKVFDRLLRDNYIAGSGSGVLVKRIVFGDIGIFDESLRSFEDIDMWLRISQKYEVDFVDKPLVTIRYSSQSLSNQLTLMLIERIKFYKKWIKYSKANKEVRIYWFKQLLYRCKILVISSQESLECKLMVVGQWLLLGLNYPIEFASSIVGTIITSLALRIKNE